MFHLESPIIQSQQGLTPPVFLMSEVPNTSKESFLSESPFAIIKDNVLGLSDPFRYDAKLASIIAPITQQMVQV